MPKNRVEELEETVQSLEATVAGLTNEIAVLEQRIRSLEADDQARAEGAASHQDGQQEEPGVALDSADIIVA